MQPLQINLHLRVTLKPCHTAIFAETLYIQYMYQEQLVSIMIIFYNLVYVVCCFSDLGISGGELDDDILVLLHLQGSFPESKKYSALFTLCVKKLYFLRQKCVIYEIKLRYKLEFIDETGVTRFGLLLYSVKKLYLPF